MSCFEDAANSSDNVYIREKNLNYANKLLRSFSMLIDTLNKYRDRGVSQQKVTVEHVNVHSGGQAIVGNVEKKEK